MVLGRKLPPLISVGEGRTIVFATDGCKGCLSAFEKFVASAQAGGPRRTDSLRRGDSLRRQTEPPASCVPEDDVPSSSEAIDDSAAKVKWPKATKKRTKGDVWRRAASVDDKADACQAPEEFKLWPSDRFIVALYPLPAISLGKSSSTSSEGKDSESAVDSESDAKSEASTASQKSTRSPTPKRSLLRLLSPSLGKERKASPTGTPTKTRSGGARTIGPCTWEPVVFTPTVQPQQAEELLKKAAQGSGEGSVRETARAREALAHMVGHARNREFRFEAIHLNVGVVGDRGVAGKGGKHSWWQVAADDTLPFILSNSGGSCTRGGARSPLGQSLAEFCDRIGAETLLLLSSHTLQPLDVRARVLTTQLQAFCQQECSCPVRMVQGMKNE